MIERVESKVGWRLIFLPVNFVGQLGGPSGQGGGQERCFEGKSLMRIIPTSTE